MVYCELDEPLGNLFKTNLFYTSVVILVVQNACRMKIMVVLMAQFVISRLLFGCSTESAVVAEHYNLLLLHRSEGLQPSSSSLSQQADICSISQPVEGFLDHLDKVLIAATLREQVLQASTSSNIVKVDYEN